MHSVRLALLASILLALSPTFVRADDPDASYAVVLGGLDAGLPPPAQDPIDVTIVGTSLARTAGSAHVIREKQLERQEYDDAHAVLLQVPGVYVRQEDGIGLRPNIGLRGANPDRSKKITLMEDGVLFGPAPYSAPAAYFFPLMTRITNVRVIKGPSAVAYGPQTVGGAIDFVSRKIPEGPLAGGVDLATGQYGYGKAHAYAGASTERFGFSLEGVHLRTHGFYDLPSGANTGSQRNEWVAKAHYVLDPAARYRNEFGAKLTYSDEVSNESYLGLTDADFRRNPYRRYAAAARDRMDQHRTSIVLSHTLDGPKHGLRIKTQAYRHDMTRSWNKVNRFRGGPIGPILRNPDDPANAAYYDVLRGAADSGSVTDTLMIGPNARTFISQGVQSVASMNLDTGPVAHRLEAGIRLHYDSIRRNHSEDGFLMSNGQLVRDSGPTSVTAYNKGSTLAFAAHVMAASTWKRLTVTPGLRVEVIDSRLHDYLSDARTDRLAVAVMPGLSAYYALLDELGLLAGVHRGFSPPPPGSAGAVAPEYSVNYEAGARLHAGKARLEVIGFYNAYSNMTDICTFSSGCFNEFLDRQTDAGKARTYGLEVFGAHELKVGRVTLPLSVAYTFSRGEFLNGFSSPDPIYGVVRRGDDMPYIPRHQLNATLAVETRRAGGSAIFNYVAKMREEPGDEALARAWTTDDQLWLDLEAHLTVIGRWMIYANARNVLGAENLVSRRPYGARVNAPRWIQVGTKLKF